MLRGAALATALSVLIASCALVTQPPPPGTQMIQAQVKNNARVPVELAVSTPSGVLPGAVQPASLDAGATGDITFYIPIGGDWWITVNGMQMFPAADVYTYARQRCGLGMEVSTDGSGGIGCYTPR